MKKPVKKVPASKRLDILNWYSIYFKTIYEPAKELEVVEKKERKKKISKSKIITFYSYKGGVGRSMALANIAYLLAEKYLYKGYHQYFYVHTR